MTCVECASVWNVDTKTRGVLDFHAEMFVDENLLAGFEFVKPSIAVSFPDFNHATIFLDVL